LKTANGQGFTGLDDSTEAYTTAMTIQSMESSTSSETGDFAVLSVMSRYGLIDSYIQTDYNLLTVAAKTAFRQGIAGVTLTEPIQPAFTSDCARAMVVAFFKTAESDNIANYSQLASIKNDKSGINFTYDVYAKIKDQQRVFTLMISNNDYNSLLSAQPALSAAAITKINADFITNCNLEYLYENPINVTPTPNPNPTRPPSTGDNSGSGTIIVPTTTATPTPITIDNIETIFTDLKGANVEWAYPAFVNLYNSGVMVGYPDGTMRPNDNITREEYVKTLVVDLGYTLESGSTPFTDVSASEWYAPYIYTAYKNGLISGISDTQFGVGNLITRQDMCVIAYRALGNAGTKLTVGTLDYADAAQISDYAKDAISAMSGAGILSGVGNGNFEPLGNATRAEAAKVVNKINK
jgi:hypothetical protein